MKNQRRWGKCFLFPIFGIGFVAIVSTVVMLLWNGVLADVVAVKTITFWQAAGLLILSRILFGGFGRGGRGRFGPPWMRGRRAMRERWLAMSPEEREKMRGEMRARFGDWPRPGCCGPDDDADETAPADKNAPEKKP